MASTRLVLLVVLARFRVYNAGEVMGATEEHAADLVKNKACRYLETDEYEALTGRPLSKKPANIILKQNDSAAALEPAVVEDGGDGGEGDAGDGEVDLLDTRTHDLSAADAAKLVASIEDYDELSAVRAGEEAHPKYEGGRKAVLAAIDAAAAEFVDDDPDDEGTSTEDE